MKRWREAVAAALLATALAACQHQSHSPKADSAPAPPEPTTNVVEPPAAPTGSNAVAQPRIVQPFAGVTVYPDLHEVHLTGASCLEDGFLEQVACAPNTREHESLVVTEVLPSEVHAALLMAGLSPGAPGRWVYETDSYNVVAPTGDSIAVHVRYTNAGGEEIEEPIQNWMREVTRDGFRAFPPGLWVFGGSRFESNPDFMGPGEHYVADMTGSIVGLVTFGDEVVGFSRVMPDLEDVREPIWEVDPNRVPPMGTPVMLIMRRASIAP